MAQPPPKYDLTKSHQQALGVEDNNVDNDNFMRIFLKEYRQDTIDRKNDLGQNLIMIAWRTRSNLHN